MMPSDNDTWPPKTIHTVLRNHAAKLLILSVCDPVTDWRLGSRLAATLTGHVSWMDGFHHFSIKSSSFKGTRKGMVKESIRAYCVTSRGISP